MRPSLAPWRFSEAVYGGSGFRVGAMSRQMSTYQNQTTLGRFEKKVVACRFWGGTALASRSVSIAAAPRTVPVYAIPRPEALSSKRFWHRLFSRGIIKNRWVTAAVWGPQRP